MIGSLPDLLASRALLGPDRIALEQDGRTLTYAELDRRAAAAAALMAERGVGEGDRVAILSRNRMAFFEVLFGCAKLGAILVPLNWRMPSPELDQLLDDCDPVLLFCEGNAGPLRDRLPTIDLDADYEEALAGAPAIAVRREWPESAIWYLLYTSGTTGRPKGVIYTFRMALANAVNIGAAIDLRSTDTTLCFLPHFHTAGINLHSLPTLFAGGRVIVLESFEPKEIVQLLEARRLDALFAVPTVYQALIDHPRFGDAPLDHVRHWGCGGAPLPDSLVERYKPLGVRICNGMGMTETGPTAFLLDPADAWSRIGSVGKPQLLCGVRIVDGDGRDVAEGEVGDLLFGGPGVTPGYWRNPEATAAAFTADGWLRSGDLVRRDGDGFHYVVGRRKDMFISGGANIYPAEIENVLAAHPAVAEAAVVAAPDPYWGEIGQAFVLPAQGAAVTVADLETHCRARLAGYKVPRRFELVADFPRTAAGKIQKHRLLTRAEEAGATASAE